MAAPRLGFIVANIGKFLSPSGALRRGRQWNERTPETRPRFLVALAGLILLCAGCEIDYFGQLIAGELCSLFHTMPVGQALADPRLSEDARGELALTQEVRQFGIDHLGLTAGSAFTVFLWDGSGPAAYVVTASAKDSLTPFKWCFPLLGPWEAKGYFDEGMARREAERLAALDYDVFLGRAESFSTLGFFPDPVRESNLQHLDEIDLAELILHEMTHSTVIKQSDTGFSESLATFVGRTGAQAWFGQRFGPDSAEAQAARDRFADEAVMDEFVNDLVARMKRYYADAAASGQGRQEIIAGREAEFEAARVRYETEFRPRLTDQERWGKIGQAQFNNAMLATAIQYESSLSDYQAVLDKVGGSLPDALAVFHDAAGSPDSRQFLRDWVLQH
jgi:predicted aminopeptidase